MGIAPHYLSYFNSFCGGPSEGYRYLVDSSLDWGQDLPLAPPGAGGPGLSARWPSATSARPGPPPTACGAVDWMAPDGPTTSDCDWLAISATSMQGAYGGSSELFERFGGLPSIRAGYSIFLYDLKDPRARAAWDAPPPRTDGPRPGGSDRAGPLIVRDPRRPVPRSPGVPRRQKSRSSLEIRRPLG